MTEKVKKPDEPEDVIDAGKAEGGHTATGQEAERRDGTEGKRIDAQESRGGPESEDDIQPDFLKPAKNVGLQTEAAEFAANGSLPARHVASNSGVVPVSAIASTTEDADKRLAEQKAANARRSSGDGKQIDEDTINKMSRDELRAVATDRGYNISSAAGTRGVRAAFKQAQSEDKALSKK